MKRGDSRCFELHVSHLQLHDWRLRLARTVYIHCIWPYFCSVFGDFPAKNYVYIPYIYGSGQPYWRCICIGASTDPSLRFDVLWLKPRPDTYVKLSLTSPGSCCTGSCVKASLCCTMHLQMFVHFTAHRYEYLYWFAEAGLACSRHTCASTTVLPSISHITIIGCLFPHHVSLDADGGPATKMDVFEFQEGGGACANAEFLHCDFLALQGFRSLFIFTLFIQISRV